MLFFQILLVVGYAYTHFLWRYADKSRLIFIHGLVIGLSLLQLPLEPTSLDIQAPEVVQVLVYLLLTIGFPGLVVASTAPMVQIWFHRSFPERSPYPLYALSNIGSFLALLGYPILIEPVLSRSNQLTVWSGGYVLFLMTLGYCLWLFHRSSVVDEAEKPSNRVFVHSGWILWPILTSALLLAITERITTDLLVLPLLWVVPLALYLLSFVVAFSGWKAFARMTILIAMVIAIPSLLFCVLVGFEDIRHQLLMIAISFFVICLACHSELVNLRPEAGELTVYYLCISIGGALGGLLVSLLLPVLFAAPLDLELVLLGICLYVLFQTGRRFPLPTIAYFALIGLCGFGIYRVQQGHGELVEQSRNFYGALEVYRQEVGTPDERKVLRNGGILHGVQFTSPDKSNITTGYYSANSGAALAFKKIEKITDRKIGLVGLGVGTLAAYTKPGDELRIYEINPEIIRIAQEQFTFLPDDSVKTVFVLGDARKALTEEAEATLQGFDLLLLDAFIGDSIPLHLLTVEAFKIYLKHLKPGGQIAVLVDTFYMDFGPSMRALSNELGLHSIGIHTNEGEDENWGAVWYLLAREPESLPIQNNLQVDVDESALLTDDYVSIWNLLDI